MEKILLDEKYEQLLFQIPLLRDLPHNIKQSLLEKLEYSVYSIDKKDIVARQGTPCKKTDDVHCADHRGMPAHGGHRAGYFTAHRSADDRQLVLAPVPPHHLAFHRHRLPQLPGRADDFFLLECPLGCIHYILFHHYLCHLQDGKKFLAIFATLNQKTQWKSKFSH